MIKINPYYIYWSTEKYNTEYFQECYEKQNHVKCDLITKKIDQIEKIIEILETNQYNPFDPKLNKIIYEIGDLNVNIAIKSLKKKSFKKF